jgi:site-specific recombinase
MTKPQTVPNGNLQAMSDLATQSLTAMSGALTAWMRDTGKVHAEAVRFLNERFEKDMELLTRFAQCRKPEDIATLQSKALAALVSDYVQESQTMFGLLGALSSHGMEQAQKMAPRPAPR